MRLTSHTLRCALLPTIAALALALAPSAMAGKPTGGGGGGGKPPKGGGGSGTISLVLLESTDGRAHWNQRVTFNVATTATTTPYVNMKCYQGGALVAESMEGFFASSLDDQIMGLASPRWIGGDADCTAYLVKPDRTVLGSTSFHVYA